MTFFFLSISGYLYQSVYIVFFVIPTRTKRGSIMEFIDVIHARTSIREYSEKPVEDEKILYVLECARLAPSAANKQCWRFIVIKNTETIAHIAKTSVINRWLKTAPVLIVCCADPTESVTKNSIQYYTVDAAIAVEHLILAATDVGLGTCWVAGFHEEKLKKLLDIPRRIRIVALTPLGYPVAQKGIVERITKTLLQSKKRKTVKEIIHHEHW